MFCDFGYSRTSYIVFLIYPALSEKGSTIKRKNVLPLELGHSSEGRQNSFDSYLPLEVYIFPGYGYVSDYALRKMFNT